MSGTTPVTRPGSSKAGLSATSIHAACSRLAALEWPVRDRERRASAVLHMLCWHARRRIMPQSTATRSPRKVSRVAHAVYHRNTHALHGMPRVSACARVDACECVRVLARLSTAPHLQCTGALTLTAPAPSRPPPRWWRPMHGRGMRIKADWDCHAHAHAAPPRPSCDTVAGRRRLVVGWSRAPLQHRCPTPAPHSAWLGSAGPWAQHASPAGPIGRSARAHRAASVGRFRGGGSHPYGARAAVKGHVGRSSCCP